MTKDLHAAGKGFEMSEVGRKSTFPLHSFSWDVLSPRVAKKQLDRSAFLHNGTGVPAAITWFFGISESGRRSDEVSLGFNGRTFDARIPVDNKGRYRLFWKNDFASALGQAFPDCLSAYQQKLNPNQDAWMQFEKVSATRYEVKVSTKQGAESVWTTRELRASINAYLGMLRCHRDGTPFTKKDYYRDLSKRFGRTEKAFEYRFQNISHVLELQGRDWVPGLRPLSHVGHKVTAQLESLLAQAEGVGNDGSATFEARVRAARKRKHRKMPGGSKNPKTRTTSSTSRERDHNVKAWVLDEAAGQCECCSQPGPFVNSDNDPYLEVHHVRRLADDGSDTITNAVALCPNCHRALHYSTDRSDRKAGLYDRVARLIKE